MATALPSLVALSEVNGKKRGEEIYTGENGDNRGQLNNPAASCGVSKLGVKIWPKGVTPECFIGGPVRNPPGFPLKTCGNDSL
jgi:hypothetical protein